MLLRHTYALVQEAKSEMLGKPPEQAKEIAEKYLLKIQELCLLKSPTLTSKNSTESTR